MNQKDNQLKYLLTQFANSNSSPEEESELFSLLSSTENEVTAAILTSILEDTAPMPDRARRQRLLDKIFDPSFQKVNEAGAVVKMRLFSLKRIAVAASVLLMISIGSYFLFFNKHIKHTDIATINTVPQDIKAPASNRATITMANGQSVYLDSAMNGQLAQQNGVDVVKLADGRIAYNGVATELAYNTLTNPRGSKAIDMTLADGSRVWLNAGSSITYPVAFIEAQRKVSISGEAYFEVAHDANRPFIVNKEELNVAVLGTHFNVNAYDDENDIRVTLLEGSVKVYNTQNSILIKPGQQAIANKNATLSLNNDIDIDEIMAWKNGKFIFNSTHIENIMRQVSKWYDVEVVFEGKVSNETFSGVVNRDSNISQVLRILEESGVKCKIEGNKIIVSA